LPTVVPLMLGLSVTGFPVVTHDIGGYISSTNPPTTKDLFFRWTTLGALTPVMRTHHGRDAAANWRWDSDGETRAHFVRWSQFHQARVPHWKGLALDAAETGAPILRPLAFADPGDVRLTGVKDEYLIGDDYLVAPVLTASTARRAVILPRGVWYPIATPLMPVEGPAEIEVEAPLTAIPVFARGGAIIPLIDAELPTLNGTDAQRVLDGARVVEVWLGGSGRSRDARGGTWAVESASRPTTPFIMVEGATDVRAEVLGELRCSAAANGTVTLRADDGGVHTIVAQGHSPNLRVQYLIRY
jgi:alpha-glucosidase (family GH31 glycosyl hydrolase)